MLNMNASLFPMPIYGIGMFKTHKFTKGKIGFY